MIDGHIAFASSGIIVPGDRGYSLQKRGLASAIFTHHDGNRVVEIEFEIFGREASRTDTSIWYQGLFRAKFPASRPAYSEDGVADS
jgi:hypothetical protein